MSLVIYLIGGIIKLAIVLAIPFFLLYFLYWFGKKFHKFHLEKLLPLSVVLTCTLWGSYNYYIFSELCHSFPSKIFYSFPDVKQNGFMVHSLETRSIPGNFNGYSALDSGEFKWMELRERTLPRIRTEYYNSSEIKVFKLDQGVKSNYSFTVKPLEPIEKKLFSPIYVYRVNLKKIGSEEILAEAKELVFGGGILGFYLSLAGGDQDFRYYSCGYISSEIGPWRPTLSSRPLSKAYEKADSDFIIKALSPIKASGEITL